MKKLFFTLLILCQFSVSAFAMNYIVGAKGGYFEWRPYVQDMKGSGIEEMNNGNGVLYGPVLSVMLLPELSFSFAALYGNQSAFWSNNGTVKKWGPGNEITADSGTNYAEITRLDIDSAISYTIFENFKLIAGYKYQKIDCDISITFVTLDDGNGRVYNELVTIETPSQGPAFGFGYTMPLGSNIFCAVNITGLYMFGKYEITENTMKAYEADSNTIVLRTEWNMPGGPWDIRQYGFNIEPVFGANVQDNLIMTIGGRFQLIRTQFVDKPLMSGDQIAPDGWMNDYLYGVFAGIMYMF